MFFTELHIIRLEPSNCVIMANVVLIRMASYGIPTTRENFRARALHLEKDKNNARVR